MKSIILKTNKKTGVCEAFTSLTHAVFSYGLVAYQTVANVMAGPDKRPYENEDVRFEKLELQRNPDQKRKASTSAFRKIK